jgi:Protein of unknown function (DUF3800)
MWLCYLDETGNTGTKLDDPDQPLHLLVGLMVPEDQVMALDLRLQALIEQLKATHDLSLIELHGSEMFSGSGPWAGVAPAHRIAAYGDALEALEFADVSIAYASVDKPKLAQKKYSVPVAPHLLAFNFLLEKIDRYLVGQNDPLRQRAILWPTRRTSMRSL